MMLFVIVPLWLIALILFLSSKDAGKVLAMLGGIVGTLALSTALGVKRL